MSGDKRTNDRPPLLFVLVVFEQQVGPVYLQRAFQLLVDETLRIFLSQEFVLQELHKIYGPLLVSAVDNTPESLAVDNTLEDMGWVVAPVVQEQLLVTRLDIDLSFYLLRFSVEDDLKV